MTNFIKVCKQADEEVHFYKISEINKEKDKINIEKGKRVRMLLAMIPVPANPDFKQMRRRLFSIL